MTLETGFKNKILDLLRARIHWGSLTLVYPRNHFVTFFIGRVGLGLKLSPDLKICATNLFTKLSPEIISIDG